MSEARTAILYTRHSPRPGRIDCESCEVQLDRARAYCRYEALEILGEYSDRHESGTHRNRPELKRALDHACATPGSLLVVTKLDRFARKIMDALNMLDELQRAGSNLAIVQLSINTSTAHGRLFFQQLAAFAEFEAAMISERTCEALGFMRAQGRRLGRADRCPYGWMADVNRPSKPGRVDPTRSFPMWLTENPLEQAIIRRIVELRAAGWKYIEIRDEFNWEGVPSRTGKPWVISGICRIYQRAKQRAQAGALTGPIAAV